MHRLQEREHILNEKRREMEEILRTHDYLQGQVNANKQHDQQFRTTLASEYKSVMEDKKRKVEDERRQRIDDEQNMLQHNQRMFEVEQERKRWEMQQTKRAVQEELAMKESQKLREKQEKEREKEEFNRKVAMRNNMETQKEAMYKQYYSQFMDNQNRLQNVYEDKTAPQNHTRDQAMNDFLRK